MFKRTHNYYIDESGDLNEKGSSFFFVGCVIIDDSDFNSSLLEKLRYEIDHNPVFANYSMKNGFHACENHPEVYNKYMELIYSLDFRAYILMIDKKTDYFEGLASDLSKQDIYNKSVFQLLYGRLMKRCLDKNILFFEGQGNKRVSEAREKESLILNINKTLLSNHKIKENIDFEVNIIGKEDINISLIDYVLHITHRYYRGDNGDHIQKNFVLIKQKIGLLIDVSNKKYISLRRDSSV